MELHPIDIAIICGYVVLVIVVGWLVSKKASKDLDAYFLGGKSLPWWIIGTSHGASGFDITGTMWFVAMLFTYGVKAAFIPWVWPLFDRIFRQVYLAAWIRRSNVLTGAEWMRTRFGTGTAGNLSHLSVVAYALIGAIGFLAYAFQGIGKFAEVFFPWDLSLGPWQLALGSWEFSLAAFSSSDVYAIVILLLTTVYLLMGGWYSVVITDLLQFVLLTVASVFIAVIAMQQVSAEALQAAVPVGWDSLFFGWKLNLDWSQHIPALNDKIYGAPPTGDGYSWFGVVIGLMLCRGLMVSAAGPTPGYGIQHVLSTRNPREAALENWWMSIVQLIPRFLMITGIAVLGLVFFTTQVNELVTTEGKFDFERILPLVIRDFVPVGLVGIVVAGLLAAFMSTFDSTVNSGAAYIVNDIYKRYLRPEASNRRLIRMSYFWSLMLVAVAIVAGLQIDTIHGVTGWITGLLYAGYVAPNILKWHWWRFNGYGYCAGMLAGVLAALVFPHLLPHFNKMYAMFLLLPVSTLAAVCVCLLTPPDDREVLKGFYRDVRPWGFWKPVRDELRKQYPALQANRNFWRDALNVANGIVWQLMLMVIPICLVIRQYKTMWAGIAVLAVTSVIMKRLWYDRLNEDQGYLDEGDPAHRK